MSRVRLGAIDIAYTDAGRGPAVVLLHGYPFNRSMWDGQVAALEDRYRVVAPDLRGHGESGAGAEETATMEAMAGDVAALLDGLGIERAVLGGLSMGGYVAMAFYRLHPERVRALVLADTRATADSEEARRGRFESARKILAEGMKAVPEVMLPKVLAPSTLAEQPETVARVREMMLGTNPAGAAAAMLGMAARRDQMELLARVEVPALVVVGSEDSITPPAEAEAMRRALPRARLAVVEGAGHVSNVERPEEFNRALRDFLEALEP